VSIEAIMRMLWPTTLIRKRLAHGLEGAPPEFVEITAGEAVPARDAGGLLSSEERQHRLHTAWRCRQDKRGWIGHRKYPTSWSKIGYTRFAERLKRAMAPGFWREWTPPVYSNEILMRTPSANAKSAQGLSSVITATKKLWRQYHLTYDQTHYVAKEVRRALGIERPKTRKRAVARLSWEEERQLIAHAYRVQGTRGLLIKTLFQTGARVSEFVNITADEVCFEE
jgi:hypothetical protein